MGITLLVENNPKIELVYRLNLTAYVGLEVVSCPRLGDALDLLLQQDIGLIITRARIDKNEAAQEIAAFLEKSARQIPLIVLGNGQIPAMAKHHIVGGLDVKGLMKAAAHSLGITPQDMIKKTVADRYPIPLHYFHFIGHPPCDILTEQGQIFCHQNSHLDRQALRTLQDRHTEFLCVDKFERLKLVNYITAEITALLDEKELNPEEQLQATEMGVELLSKKLLTIGITEETITLAKKSMTTISGNVKKYPKLAVLLKRLLSNQASYLFRHTQILTYVGLHIIRNIDWGTPEQEEKISFICFFHDIALETDEQGMIKNKEELRKANLTTKEKALVERHAQLAAELVHKFPHAPMGSDQIIRQHHGMLNGVGFSDHYGANLSPMAIVFIIAEEFTRIILKAEQGPFNTKEMLRELREIFPMSRFKKIIDLLEDVTF